MILFVIHFCLGHWKTAMNSFSITSINIVSIIHLHRHLNAEDQVRGNHLLQRHVLTGRISHTHLTPSRSEGPVCGCRALPSQKSNPSEMSPSRSSASSFVSILTTWGQRYLKTHHFPPQSSFSSSPMPFFSEATPSPSFPSP